MYYECLGSFDSAHFLKGYEGNCRNLHGHTWEVKVRWKGKDLILGSLGIGIDMKVLKLCVDEVLERFDHTQLNVLEEFNFINPTAENLSVILWQRINRVMRSKGYDNIIELNLLTIWETRKCSVELDVEGYEKYKNLIGGK